MILDQNDVPEAGELDQQAGASALHARERGLIPTLPGIIIEQGKAPEHC